MFKTQNCGAGSGQGFKSVNFFQVYIYVVRFIYYDFIYNNFKCERYVRVILDASMQSYPCTHPCEQENNFKMPIVEMKSFETFDNRAIKHWRIQTFRSGGAPTNILRHMCYKTKFKQCMNYYNRVTIQLAQQRQQQQL